MITGKYSGSGKYQYHCRTSGKIDVQVTKLPEDFMQIRIAFKENGEIYLPILKIAERQAELLWACLNEMAKESNWKDQLMIIEPIEESK